MTPARKYLPLIPGTVLRYRGDTPSETSESTMEVLELRRYPTHTAAICRNSWCAGSHHGGHDFVVKRSARGIHSHRELELPSSVQSGMRWSVASREFRIDSLNAVVEAPAGRFRDCLEITYLVAGGDGGFGKRYYAPWVGLVREDNAEEAESWRRELTGSHVPYEVFLAHASEDKEGLARPLATALARRGFHVWYDESNLQLGDRFEQVLATAIAKSICGVAILSRAFLSKRWTTFELQLLQEKLRFVILNDVTAGRCQDAVPHLNEIRHATASQDIGSLLKQLVTSLPDGMAD